MKLNLDVAEIFVPDGTPVEEALARTTHMGIGAHQDDLEAMASHGILTCFQRTDRWFCGVVVTDGSGAPRGGPYADCTDEELRAIRKEEQIKAAVLGEYGAQALLGYPSTVVKDAANHAPVEDLRTLLEVAGPAVVYTHNPADKHDTHVATTLRVVEAIRSLPADERPHRLYGCEVWRGLDWLLDDDKTTFDTSSRKNLQRALLGVFDSQISSGKRYDLATMGRRRANATYHASHQVNVTTGMTYALDLTPLIAYPERDVASCVRHYIDRLAQDVQARIERLS